MFVISNSGRNPQPVDVALRARELGLRVIAVTSLAHTQGVASRHSSGRRLFELADVVLDTGTPPGDASLSVAGLAVWTGPVSTALGVALMNAVMVEAMQKLVERGVAPPVLMSSNLDEGGALRPHEERLQPASLIDKTVKSCIMSACQDNDFY